MLELLLCSLLTIFPDYLYRRYRQGKRIGHEITLYSVWFELRFGIVACLMLTVSLITMIFYFHPSTTSATLYYRTVPIVPETIGRVAEVHVDYSAEVKKGDVIFRLDNSKQQAALETARRKIAEIDAVDAGGAGRYPEGGRPASGGERLGAAGAGRTRHQKRTAEAQPRNRAATRHRKARGGRRRSPGQPRRRDRVQTIRDDARQRAPPGREGKRGGSARRSAGRSGQDLYSRRRRMAVSSSSCCGRAISSIP